MSQEMLDTVWYEHQIAIVNKRNADLEAKLKSLEWQEITEENLPKLGDELFNARRGKLMAMPEGYVPMIPMVEDFTMAGWTHFRPIAAPPTTEEQR